MIQLKNITKSYGKRDVLHGISMNFPSKGLICICGQSGCGKTTLLNILGLLTPFTGKYNFDEDSYKYENNKKIDYVRNSKIGFVFQDYKLFEFETVENNIKLAADLKISDSNKNKNKLTRDLLKIVSLENKRNSLVSDLSGGEKQRVAIARAIVNSPKLLLADEPTGNLDVENSYSIFDILKKLSEKSLVAVVSHDTELAAKYADKVFLIKDGQIISEKSNIIDKTSSRLSIIKVNSVRRMPSISLSFCFRHALNNIKHKKWRNVIVMLAISIGLIGVGLGSLISNVISTNLIKSYSSIIDNNKVVMTTKEQQESNQIIYSLEDQRVNELKNVFQKEIEYDGIYYSNNFNQFFTAFNFSINNEYTTFSISSLTPQHFNDFRYLNDCKNEVYGKKKTNLFNNQIILGTTPGLLNEICYQLHIERTIDSFQKYINNNDLFIEVYLENSGWQFYKEFSLEITGFMIDNSDCFIHDSLLWNEYIFEDVCQFQTTNIVNSNTEHPWDLKRIHYFQFSDKRDEFLREIKFKRDYLNIVSEVLTDDYYPYLYNNVDSKDYLRVGLFSFENKDLIPAHNYFNITEVDSRAKHPVPGTQNSYVSYPNNLMMGFARQTYISIDSNYLENVIDLTSYIKSNEDNILNYPDNVIMGYFAKSNGLKFSSEYTLTSGREPTNYNEIVISKGVVDALKINNPINKSIYLCFPKSEELLSNGYIKRNFVLTDIKIVGVSNSSRLELNHFDDWTVMFFQSKLKISSFDLQISSFSMNVESGYSNDVINKLNRAFPRYSSVNPVSNITGSINSICSKIELILTILSISSLIIATILLTMCNNLHFAENKQDIGLIRCLGTTKWQSSKLIFAHSFIITFSSFVLSLIELFLICFILTKSLASTLSIETEFVFNISSIIYMLIVAVCISFLTSIFSVFKLNKLTPLECLQ